MMIYILLRGKTALLALVFFCIVTNAFSQQVNIIPYPQNVEKANGEFTITNKTKIIYDQADSKELSVALAPLVLKLQLASGINLQSALKRPRKHFIEVELTDRIAQSEGYDLNVGPKSIKIEAATPAGVFYAVQSLLQLLPVEIESPTIVKNIQLKIPAMIIDDSPAFG